MDEAGGRWSLDAEASGAGGDTAVGLDSDSGALAEDGGPPKAFGGRAQCGSVFLLGEEPGGERGRGQFAVALVGGAMGAEVFEEGVGGGEGGDGFGSAEGGEAVLPVLMAALDFLARPPTSLFPSASSALGLRGGGVTEGDAIEVEGGAEPFRQAQGPEPAEGLGEGVGHRGEEEGVATRDARASELAPV